MRPASQGAQVSRSVTEGLLTGGAAGRVVMLGCYHPSQQNTFTGRVTPAMLDEVFGRARRAAGIGGTAPDPRAAP